MGRVSPKPHYSIPIGCSIGEEPREPKVSNLMTANGEKWICRTIGALKICPVHNSPFDPNAISQVSGGFTIGGTGWYRKEFTVPVEHKNKRIYLQFDGVYMNAEFWLNNISLGSHPYGYTSFWFDITDQIKPGEQNLLSVKVMNEGQNSRWYTGSGIYRHVWLRFAEPVHIGQWGVSVTTPDVSEHQCKGSDQNRRH